MKRTKAGGKNPDGQGFSLDRLDRRNGRRTGIVFRNWIWYNFPQYKSINRNREVNLYE